MGLQHAKLSPLAGAGPCCFDFLERTKLPRSSASSSSRAADAAVRRTCGSCGESVTEFAQGARGDNLCRSCIRREDEALLEPLAQEERRGLDALSAVLDRVPWSYWKPGEQPAELLDWLCLGDLEEAMDFTLLADKKITAVVNLINWWELAARLPDVSDLASLYGARSVDFLEADSEDRIFFDIVEKCWPAVEVFLKTCRSKGQRVLVNCKAGHNRSACVCICWLLIHEGMTLLEAAEWVLLRRGTILSNHGFRLQLVRAALKLGRLGEPASTVASPVVQEAFDADAERAKLGNIIKRKRKSAKYDYNSKDYSNPAHAAVSRSALIPRKSPSLILGDVADQVTQRTLKLELLACLYHRGRNFSSDYEYTSDPPTVIGSGFSGDVVLCKRREKTAVRENKETGVRCVKTFNLKEMGPDKHEKLKNEAVIYLSLEHPYIARLFDVYDDQNEVSLVMQYCSGGTLEQALKERGRYSEADFQHVAAPMLLAVSYIHRMGIVHRDIKPRNWVYEADGVTVKLIDFGFSAKENLSDSRGLFGCMGTLGYLAPEVVKAGLSADIAYTEKCDIWSLGVVFFELLAGQPAFHREKGLCDGYTEEVVLREIDEVTDAGVEALLGDVPEEARPFLRRLLAKDMSVRPSAREVLDDPYLTTAREQLMYPPCALPMDLVLERFRAHGRTSKPTRAWLLAVARSPTYLPWPDFCALRNTFKMFDARSLTGTVNLETFLSVVLGAIFAEGESVEADVQEMEEEVRSIWAAVCGSQESLSYCEFLAALLPPIEDVFEDVEPSPVTRGKGPPLPPVRSSDSIARSPASPEASPKWIPASPFDTADAAAADNWDPSAPVSRYLPLLRMRRRRGKVPIFSEHMQVKDLVAIMNKTHNRWVLIKYEGGRQAFFDYMDINHQLVKISGGTSSGPRASETMARISCMAVGAIANSSGHSSYVPVFGDVPLRDVLRLVAGRSASQVVRRVPIVDSGGEVLHVFTCLDFLDIALQFTGPSAVLKSSAARTFDRRATILQLSVPHDDAVLSALRIMDAEHLTVCPAASRELSGDLGGVVAVNVVSVSDLKYVIGCEQFDILDNSVSDFVAWRSSVEGGNLDQRLRRQRLRRFNVVSVHAGDSLHTLAHRLLASKLQRIFLSSDDIARIVGIVSSRDILVEVFDQMV